MKLKLLFLCVVGVLATAGIACAHESQSPLPVDGDKVVYTENLSASETTKVEKATGEPVIEESGVKIYQTDLTAKEEKELDKKSNVIVEDNIDFLASEWVSPDTADKIKSKCNAEWNVDMIKADGIRLSGNSVKVAVMDSGVDYISDANVTKSVNLVETEQDYENMLSDMTGHGTSVASIINQINPNAEIYSVRILDEDNKSTLSRVIAGLYWCLDNDVDIINMSFGTGTNSKILEKAINDVKDKGALMMSAAGNNPKQGTEYPAKYKDVVAVGSVDETGKPSENSADGEINAPGENVFAQSMLGMYTEVSGTSVATPHAVAAASILWQKDKKKSDDFIRGLLTASSNKDDVVDLKYAEKNFNKFKESKAQSIPENNATSDIEGTVVANWGKDSSGARLHQTIINKGLALLKKDGIKENTLTNDQILALKKGAVYPDSANMTHECYHGRRGRNWIASYKYITALAKAMKTSTTTFKPPKAKDYFGKNTFTTMAGFIKGDIQFGGIYANEADEKINRNDDVTGWNAWRDAGKIKVWESKSLLGECGYKALLKKGDKKEIANLKSLFIYGIALHNMTDAFAHATYGTPKGSSKILKIVHPSYFIGHIDTSILGADDNTVVSNRWRDASYATRDFMKHVLDGKEGQISDFYPNDYKVYKKGDASSYGKRGYYINKIIEKANQINESNTYKKAFKHVDYLSFGASDADDE